MIALSSFVFAVVFAVCHYLIAPLWVTRRMQRIQKAIFGVTRTFIQAWLPEFCKQNKALFTEILADAIEKSLEKAMQKGLPKPPRGSGGIMGSIISSVIDRFGQSRRPPEEGGIVL